MKKIIIALLMIGSINGFTYESTATCDTQLAKEELNLASDSLTSVKKSSNKSSMIELLEQARVYMCQSILNCDVKSSLLKDMMDYPCIQRPIYSELTISELIKISKFKKKEVARGAKALTSSYCHWRVTAEHYSGSDERINISLKKCKSEAEKHRKEISDPATAQVTFVDKNNEVSIVILKD